MRDVLRVIDEAYGDAHNAHMSTNRCIAARREGVQTGLLAELGQKLVYGDMDLQLLSRALQRIELRDGDSFVDVGSGYGRAVIAAACLYAGRNGVRIANSCGLEILPSLHECAVQKYGEIAETLGGDLAPCEFVLGDFYKNERAVQIVEQADCVFAFATTWDSVDDVLTTLAEYFVEHVKIGAYVLTVDKMLPTQGRNGKKFRFIEAIDGENEATGESTVHIYVVEKDQSSL